jgi:hypothetical protein
MDPLFDHEKLDVYWVDLGFVAWIAAFLDDASHWSTPGWKRAVIRPAISDSFM